MKRIALETLDPTDMLHYQYGHSEVSATVGFYDWLRSIFPTFLGVCIEPNNYLRGGDKGMPWAYCYFAETDEDKTYFYLSKSKYQ